MSALFMLRLVTWVVIVINWIVILWLWRLMKRATATADELVEDNSHLMVMLMFTTMELMQRDPDARVGLPKDTYRWAEAKALHAMVYGEGVDDE